jgi:hypothetical protein
VIARSGTENIQRRSILRCPQWIPMCFRAESARFLAIDLRCGSIRQNNMLGDDATHGFLDTKVDRVTREFYSGSEILTHSLSRVFSAPRRANGPDWRDAENHRSCPWRVHTAAESSRDRVPVGTESCRGKLVRIAIYLAGC